MKFHCVADSNEHNHWVGLTSSVLDRKLFSSAKVESSDFPTRLGVVEDEREHDVCKLNVSQFLCQSFCASVSG